MSSNLITREEIVTCGAIDLNLVLGTPPMDGTDFQNISKYSQLIKQLIEVENIIEKEHLIEKINAFPIPKTPEESVDTWGKLIRNVLHPSHPYPLHELLYHRIYSTFGDQPAPCWLPVFEKVCRTNIARFMLAKGFNTYDQLYNYSITDREEFWRFAIAFSSIIFRKSFDHIFPPNQKYGVNDVDPDYLPNGLLNITETCFQGMPRTPCINFQYPGGVIHSWTYAYTEEYTNRIASGLTKIGFKPGDRIGICMPMTPESIVIYLGIIRAGMAAVCIADSFSSQEISTRLRISEAKAIICQDYLERGGKFLPLHKRVIESQPACIIVVSVMKCDGCKLTNTATPVTIRPVDYMFDTLLEYGSTNFEPVITPASSIISILFSSGTTGDPKAIPWTNSSAIKSIIDSYLHLDTQPGETLCWPTNIGWMMGPFIIFASLGLRATIALYCGMPTEKGFVKFVQDTQVHMLGLVPSLASAWRKLRLLDGIDWSSVRRFASTGEASNSPLYLWLMSRVPGYAPVIEYCGGTEVSGGYITGTMVQPAIPAMFSTAALGSQFEILIDEKDVLTGPGEGDIVLIPPSLGLSTNLLNKNHYKVYYQNMPIDKNGQTYRRHGDCMKRFSNNYVQAHGRTDDTMNLGGIKISSAELERATAKVPGVREVACVGIDPPKGGATSLVVYAVLDEPEKFDKASMMKKMQTCIKENLNPLFKISDVVPIQTLPRTASNKVMRRVLRAQYTGKLK